MPPAATQGPQQGRQRRPQQQGDWGGVERRVELAAGLFALLVQLTVWGRTAPILGLRGHLHQVCKRGLTAHNGGTLRYVPTAAAPLDAPLPTAGHAGLNSVCMRGPHAVPAVRRMEALPVRHAAVACDDELPLLPLLLMPQCGAPLPAAHLECRMRAACSPPLCSVHTPTCVHADGTHAGCGSSPCCACAWSSCPATAPPR